MKKVLKLGMLLTAIAMVASCSSTSDSSSSDPLSSSTPTSSTTSSSSSTSSSTSPDEGGGGGSDSTGTIEETEVEVTGTTTGDLSADGQYYTDYMTLADEQQAAKKVAVQIAEEGDVLLKNDNDALPLASYETNVTLFGMHSINLITAGGGSGSGTTGNNGITPSTLESALTDAGFSVNPSTLSLYETYEAIGSINNELPLDYYTGSVVASYYAYSHAAIVTISREGTENKDLETNNVEDHADPNEHTLQLDDNEKALIKHVKENFDKVIVLINSSNIMQIPELAEEKTDSNYGVDAILWIGGVGNNGVDAVGSILNGSVNPSGHTSDLWSADFTKDPTFTNFGFDTQNIDENGDRMDASYYDEEGNMTNYTQVEYREGIYLGYKYYETRATDQADGEEWYQENVLYPFGYGLSYTTFDWEWDGVEDNLVIDKANQTVTVKVKVTNTGDVAGKDVVQVYFSAPYTSGEIEKASTNLVNFAKTNILEPGESETVTVQFVAQDMASFDWDDSNNNGFKGYELEAGNYTISANRDSHTPVLTTTRVIEDDILCQTDYQTGAEISPIFVDEFDSTNESLLENSISRADGLDQPEPASLEDRTLDDETLAEYDAQDTYDHYQESDSDPWHVSSTGIPDNWTQEETDNYNNEIMLADMSGIDYQDIKIEDGQVVTGTDEGSKKWDEFMNQLTYEDLANIVSGDNKSGPGIAAMSTIGKVVDNYADGPVQISGGTLFPSAPILAATFNVELAEQKGRLVGNEAIFLGLSQWAGPAMNTHRSPFSGRNFEYYSEDGYHAARFAEYEIKGAVSKGLITYVKHFFLNDQESYRADYGGVFTWATEQAMREIYLKPFEYAIKAGSMGAMSSFNRIGKQVTATSYAVHQYLLRDEWGSKADVCTDAWAKDYVPVNLMAVAGSDQLLGQSSSYSKNALDHGTWNASKNVVEVDDGNGGTMESQTLYAGLRIRAQRALYNRANSTTVQNGVTSDQVIDVYLNRDVSNNVQITLPTTNDISVTLADGESMPDGLSLVNGNVVSGTPTTEASYEVNVNLTVDGWVTSEAVLNIHVRSAMQLNGESIDSTAETNATLTSGEYTELTIDTPSLAYGTTVNSRLIVNWYTYDFTNYNRDEDKTAADLITIDESLVTDPEDRHEYGYSYTGNLPTGLQWEEVYTTWQGLSNRGSYEVVDHILLSGTPTETGTFEFTVTLYAPTTMYFSGWLFASFGCSFIEYTQKIVIQVV